MHLRGLKGRAAHVSQGILPAPGVFVLEVEKSARLVVLCLVVSVRMVYMILLMRLLILSMRLLILLLTPWIPLLSVVKVSHLMILAFGASIFWSDGGNFVDPWGTWWIRACRMSGRQYDLPGGAVGREFVDLLTTEVRLLTDNSAISDRLMMFCPVILQRNHMVRVGSDVRRHLK